MVEETAAPVPGAVEPGAPGQEAAPGQPQADGGVDLTDYRLKVGNVSDKYINLVSKLWVRKRWNVSSESKSENFIVYI